MAISENTTIASEALLDGERMRAAMRRLRAQAETAAEILIALMNEIDGDPDLEDTGDDEPDQDGEPSHSATNSTNQSHGWTKHGGAGMEPDAEEEFDGREEDDAGEDTDDAEHDMSDWEWSLGWSNGIHQGFNDQGESGDREDDGDDREDNGDGQSMAGRHPDAGKGVEEAERLLSTLPINKRLRSGQQLVYVGEVKPGAFVPFGNGRVTLE